MQHYPDFPRLRPDLTWTLHHFADGASYTVNNPATGSNYQVGVAEYAFASLLDGSTSVNDAVIAMQDLAERSEDRTFAISHKEGEFIADWLVKMRLASDRDEPSGGTIPAPKQTHFSALSIKMPLGDPGRIVQTLSSRFGFLATPTALAFYVLAIVIAMLQVASGLDRWSHALRPLADPSSWWIIGGTALALRVLHEAAHAVVADRFNVKVGEAGILWVLLMPLPYVDVSGSWQRNRRRERVLIAAAGMLIELVVAAIAVMVFYGATLERTQHMAATVAMTASVVTLVFNANVLMRFDGYHILVDVIGLPNLYSDAMNYWRGVSARVILGKPRWGDPAPAGWLGLFFRCYGLGILLWRVIVFVGLVLAAEHLAGGAGVTLSVIALLTLLARQIRNLPQLFSGTRWWRAVLGSVSTALVLGALWYAPVPFGESETGVVRYSQPSQIRATSDGFVRRVLVRRGDVVRSGHPLVRLESRKLDHEIAMLRLELASAETRHRRYLAENEMASVAAEWASISQLQNELAVRVDQRSGLTLCADQDGVVVAPGDLSLWLGRFVHEGTELMRIVRGDELEIVMLIDQEAREAWSSKVDRQVCVKRSLDWHTQHATLTSVAPRATDRLPRESLGAHQGGPLAVRPSDSNDTVRLLRPRFEARVAPPPEQVLYDGEKVQVSLNIKGPTIGECVGEAVSQWMDARLARHSLFHQVRSF